MFTATVRRFVGAGQSTVALASNYIRDRNAPSKFCSGIPRIDRWRIWGDWGDAVMEILRGTKLQFI
jgi:hypothetical protein